MTQGVKECITNCKEQDPLICKLRGLFERLSVGNERSLSTEQLTSQLNLDVYKQRDVAECFRSLVNELNSKMDQEHNILKIYQVTMVNSLKCLKCQRSMDEDTFFLDIPLSVCSANAAEKFDSMEKSLEQFLNVEIMEGDNKCYCDNCEMKTETSSRYYFKDLPQILTFQLKRFEFNYNYMAFQKSTDCITVPPVLEFTRSQHVHNEWCPKCTGNKALSQFKNAKNSSHVNGEEENETPIQHQEVNQEGTLQSESGRNPETPQDHSQQVLTGDEEKRYELFAIWHHVGIYGNGHYYAEIKSDSGDWYTFNDEYVEKKMDIVQSSKTAYVLMYRLLDTNCKAGISRPGICHRPVL